MGGATHQVVPADLARLEQEAPMRLAAFRLEGRLLFGRQLQRRPVVDRRQAAGELALAAPVELVCRLVAGIKAPGGLQALRRRVIDRQALGLADHQVRHDLEPGQILRDRVGVFRLRAGDVGVVIAQQEAPAMAPREQPVEQGRAALPM